MSVINSIRQMVLLVELIYISIKKNRSECFCLDFELLDISVHSLRKHVARTVHIPCYLVRIIDSQRPGHVLLSAVGADVLIHVSIIRELSSSYLVYSFFRLITKPRLVACVFAINRFTPPTGLEPVTS